MKSSALVRWTGTGLVFEGGRPGGPLALIDGEGAQAPSPVTLLLVSLATCTAADVVDITKKMRLDIRSMEVDVQAERADDHPRRVVRAHIEFRVTGGSIAEQERVQHAIDLSQQKYCSVVHSLKEDIEVSTSLTFEAAPDAVEAGGA